MSHGHEPDVAQYFGKLAAHTSVRDLDDAAVTAAKMSVLDTIGVALAATSAEPAVATVIDLVLADGGRPEAAVWGSGRRVPAAGAAFANGAMAHGLDFDDQTPWGQHASSSVVPAVLAVADRRGAVNGAELVTAVAVGQDIFARLRCHVGWRKDWNTSSVLGVYAGAAAAARVLGLSPERCEHALGIASQQSSGVMEVVAGTGSNLRSTYAGFSARGAVTAALLAERGLTGVAEVFEGPVGVFACYFGGRYDREAMLADLGKDFRGGGTLYKVWPAVGTSHGHIHAVVELMREHGLTVEDIAELRLAVGDYHRVMCTPLAERRAPETLVDAKFSLPFLVALAAVHGTVEVAHFTKTGLHDPRVRAVAEKVVPVDDALLDWHLELPPGRVEVTTTDGRVLSRVGSAFPGSQERPVTWPELAEKFRRCAAFASRPPAEADIEQAIDVAQDLDTAPDVTVLSRLLG
jgi:2-methylcitrate dehydratase PrpD